MRSLPGAGWMVTIAASRAWGSTLRWRSWMSHLLTVDAHLGVAARLRYLDKWSELLPPSRSSSRPGCRQARSTAGGSTAGLRITVVANPQGTIAPLALRNQLSCLFQQPATSSSGVGSIWGRFAPFISRGCSTGQADELSRAALPGEWRLHPQTVQLICNVLDSHR